ncbi:MAG: archease [Thermodesulfovibrionales bacterium]
MPIEMLNISGDVGILVRSDNIVDAIKEACIGMYSLMTDLKDILPTKSIDIHLEEDSLESLVVCLLNELLFQFETKGFIGNDLVIEFSEESGIFKINTNIKGESFDPNRHSRKLLIKAATYHNLLVNVDGDGTIIRIVFDI